MELNDLRVGMTVLILSASPVGCHEYGTVTKILGETITVSTQFNVYTVSVYHIMPLVRNQWTPIFGLERQGLML